ncbi:arsenate reductase ArsC [Simiduia aestuariiviva]|uniref:Arsenate reductase n=1 Tax=Simiduia aestuariiviva TaxID=1510459 RepID=A0A839UNR7_9GAMM|nr:arsenate reductase ArsC [Simiduia aestuariiviva]MBB3167025.1 arsenate reductase [Simiduia aestuariiviva]
MKSLLFVCIHNSARSQMAEAFAKRYGADQFLVYSAGLEPGVLNPSVVQVMAELDIDISAQTCRSVEQHVAQYGAPDIVITVCDEASAERCPHISGAMQLHWGFEDPSAVAGDDAHKLAAARTIRDQIQARVSAWCDEIAAL